MLNRTDIRRECNKNTYTRGEDLYLRGGVEELSWEKKKEDGFEVVLISARAKGSQGNSYEVKIKIDEDYREILEEECECMAFFSYNGLCKHCVAVLLEYLERRTEKTNRVFPGQARARLPEQSDLGKKTESLQQTGTGNAGSFPQSEEAGRIGAEGFLFGGYLGEDQNLPENRWSTFSTGRQPGVFPPERSSTYGFDAILNQYILRDKVNLLQEKLVGKVRLVPFGFFQGDSFLAEFRVGAGRLYVIKNLGDFVNAIAAHQKIYYGKELEFYHHIEVFAPEYRPLARFLLFSLMKGSRMENYLSSVYKRELTITPELADDFMESLREIPRDSNGWRWSLRDGKPERLLEIEGSGAGIQIRLQKMQMLTGKKYLYFFDQDVIWRMDREAGEEIREFLLYMDSFGKAGLYVAGSSLPAFSRDMLPVLREHFQVQYRNFDPAEYLPEEARFEVYLDAPQRDLLTCSLYAVYGEEKFNLFQEADWDVQNRDVKRNPAQELRMASFVASFFTAKDPQRNEMTLTEDDRMYEFLREGLPKLQEVCEVFVADTVKNMRLLPSPRVNVGISLAGDLLELEVSSEEMPLDRLVEILSRYDRKRKFYRLKDGSFVDLTDEGLQVLAGMKETLELSEKQLKKGKLSLPTFRAMYLDSSLQESHGLGLHKDKSFRALVRSMKTVDDSDFELPPEMEKILRGYQKTGFLWIKTLMTNGFGGILADDMGLGKTLQVIAVLLSEWREKGAQQKFLIVCPASLVYNWKSELERFAPELPVYMAAGMAEARAFVLDQLTLDGGGVLITSYDLLRRDIERYETMKFQIQVIDEAQYIKNHTTLGARAVKRVNAAFRLALTGTPVENRLSELWSIFDYLMPGFLYGYTRFREELEAPIVTKGDAEATARLQKMIRPFVLRRLKKDVLTDLPEKIEENRYAALEGEQRELYNAHVQRLVQMLDGQTEEEYASAQIQVLSELTRLRQLCCDPGLLYEGYTGGSAKLLMCLELIRNARDGGHKVLLFSQFTTMLERLKKAMQQEGISFYSLDGSTPKRRRMELVEQFNADDTQVFCISLKAGGTGLNLTGADIVIHFDPWWNVAVQNQATDRAHRIGQKNVVTVFRLIMKGSIEEKIVALQDKKQQLAEQILNQENMGLSSFTREDLLEILR